MRQRGENVVNIEAKGKNSDKGKGKFSLTI